MAVTVYVPAAVHPAPGVNLALNDPLVANEITWAKTATLDGLVITSSTVPATDGTPVTVPEIVPPVAPE